MSGNCDCKIIILVYTQPGSPQLIFKIEKEHVRSSGNQASLIILNPLVFTFNITVNVDLAQ